VNGGSKDTFTTYDGSELEVLERPQGPADPLVMRFRLVHDGGTPPPHVHPSATEVFEVEEGSFEVLVGSEWRRVSAGESVTVEPGQRHTFRNKSGATVVLRNVHDPHHDFERYMRSVAAVSHELRATKPTPAAAAKLALLWSRHDDLIRPADTPLRVAFGVLSRGARLLRVSVPEPG
jgi:quercetin dioxygenase-like cupin family protein